jgi:hypothetical protein
MTLLEDSLSLSLEAGLRIPSHEEVADQLDSPLSRDLELDLLPATRSMQDV